jgi:hypothetical protein
MMNGSRFASTSRTDEALPLPFSPPVFEWAAEAQPNNIMTRVQVAIALIIRCLGALVFFMGIIGLAYQWIAPKLLDQSDASLAYIHAQLISSFIYVLSGVFLLLISRLLVMWLSKGLDEKD